MKESMGIIKNYRLKKICLVCLCFTMVFSFMHYGFDYSVIQDKFFKDKFFNLSLIALSYLIFFATYYFNLGDKKVCEVWHYYEENHDGRLRTIWIHQKYSVLPVVLLFVL